MKNNILKTILFLVLTCLVIPIDSFGQGRNNRNNRNRRYKKQSEFISHIGFYTGGGYANLLHNIPESNNIGGGAGMLGAQYFLSHPNHFNFHVGLEVMFFNSSTQLNDQVYNSIYNYNDPNHSNLQMKYKMDFYNYKEQHNHISFNVPVMFGAEYNKFYFALGSKIKYAVYGYSFTNTDVTATATDPEFIEDLENITTHNIGTRHYKSKNINNFDLDVTASAEVGLILDSWMPYNLTYYGDRRRKKYIHYRIGLFADYGILNQNKFDHSDLLLSFPNMEMTDNGGFIVPGKDIANIHNNSMLATNISKDCPFNTLVVGVKLSVMVQTTEPPVRRRRKPAKRTSSKPAQATQQNTSTKLVCQVTDIDTQAPIDANIALLDLSKPNDTIYNVAANKLTGIYENSELIHNHTYVMVVSKAGYFNYRDTITNITNDTLMIELEPIKSNTVIVLNNLFFDTDKTIIKNTSAESLEEMYRLLVENPTIKIIIIGHTDSVGDDDYNLRLSRGRAKAVYNEMIKRGIGPDRLKWTGKGEREPIDTNATEEGRANNRRVEVKIL